MVHPNKVTRKYETFFFDSSYRKSENWKNLDKQKLTVTVTMNSLLFRVVFLTIIIWDHTFDSFPAIVYDSISYKTAFHY